MAGRDYPGQPFGGVMDIYQSTVDYVSRLPVIQSWPELQAIFSRTASGKPQNWELPLQACEAVGGSVAQAIPAVAAVACAQISIILLDDMLDEDPRGEYHHAGHAKVANYAAAFQAAAFEAFGSNEMQPEIRLSGLCSLNRMMLMTALGQHLDVQNPPDEIAYWRVVENKSAPFFGAALFMGALVGGASNQTANELEQFGRLYGEMIQIHDDLKDAIATPANPDWLQRRSSLPILFGQVVDHPEHARFLELCRDISTPEALSEAQNILVRCGAASYCMDQLLRRHQVMQEMLNTIALVRREVLDTLLEELIAPVYGLFRETGALLPELIIPTDIGNLA
jgi:geranylgeranyl diphosphate synthase type I